jgi:hypothetical protein
MLPMTDPTNRDREVMKAATPGPWTVFTTITQTNLYLGSGVKLPNGDEIFYHRGEEPDSLAAFIARARTRWPLAHAVAEAAEGFLGAWEESNGHRDDDDALRTACNDAAETLRAALAAWREGYANTKSCDMRAELE